MQQEEAEIFLGGEMHTCGRMKFRSTGTMVSNILLFILLLIPDKMA